MRFYIRHKLANHRLYVVHIARKVYEKQAFRQSIHLVHLGLIRRRHIGIFVFQPIEQIHVRNFAAISVKHRPVNIADTILF